MGISTARKSEQAALFKLGKHRCCACNEVKGLCSFIQRKNRKHIYGVDGLCKSCGALRMRNRTPEEKIRTRELQRKAWQTRFTDSIFTNTKARAHASSVPFTITKDYIKKVFLEQSGVCAVSGIPFEMEVPAYKKRSPYRPSIDRIVPNLGYIPGNIRFVLTCVNIGLNDWGLEVYLRVAKAAVEKNIGAGISGEPR